jgi:hypothetical protein
MAGHLELMRMMDHFLDVTLEQIELTLTKYSTDQNYLQSMSILTSLRKRAKLNSDFVSSRNDDMRLWWMHSPENNKWRTILVLQFNFHVIVHIFRECHSHIDHTSAWYNLFTPSEFQKFEQIETLLEAYIEDIETREDYIAEIENSRRWLLNYALEYAQLIWSRPPYAPKAPEHVAADVEQDAEHSSSQSVLGKRPSPDTSLLLCKLLEMVSF